MSKENVSDIKAEEMEQGCSTDQYAEGEIRVIQFRTGFKKFKVACNTSQRLLGALKKNPAFRSYSEKNVSKEIIIRRTKGKVPGAAVKSDFPCCLLESDEVLDINFISNVGNISTSQKTEKKFSPLNKYKTFYIRTRGKIKKTIMRNNDLALNVDYVCVYGIEGETLKTALQKDGRFSEEVFNSPCELMDIFKDASYDLSLPVDCLCEHQFEIYVRWTKQSASDIQQSSANNEVEQSIASNEAPADPPIAEQSQQPRNENQTKQRKRKGKTEKPTGPATKGRVTEITWKSENSKFPSSTEKILRDQCKLLLETLKDKPEVQQLFHAEFGKSIKNFWEVSLMKRLTKFSDAVCVIVVNKSALGTGFLLFDKFVLTNAHVVKDFLVEKDSVHRNLAVTLEAAFNYEHVTSRGECLKFKKELAAYCYKDDGMSCLDYALLELNTERIKMNYPQLLSFCKNTPPPKNGAIFIVGHPDCTSKKIDFCFITETVNRARAIMKHISENSICPYVSLQCCSDLRGNYIAYDTCFFHGASGSPVFDEHCFLIGVHTGGFDYKDSNNETRSVLEFCISMQSIRKSINETGRPDVIELLCEFERKRDEENVPPRGVNPAPGGNIPEEKELQDQNDEAMELNELESV
ncbi:serine protease FAM111A-like [Triplophysa dalaica]|uniref:serine protease FAM111A-like n=1 Tax=Triplophysa dalaica TaxID=1582913 RepID=UPI0024DF96D1|nr:serine protease FAM111A-like [Triplophysa dalaica]